MKTKTYKFRPQQFGRHSRKIQLGKYHWKLRFNWTLADYLHHVFSVLHYRSSHAPQPIQKKWRKAAVKFGNSHKKV